MSPIKYLFFSILAFIYSCWLVAIIYDIAINDIKITYWEAQVITFFLTFFLLAIGWWLLESSE